MSTSSPAETLHDDILRYIERADAMLEKGEFTSLQGLDEAVDTLCKRVTGLDAASAAQFAPKLEVLLTRLDGLQKKMQEALDACQAEVKGLDKHRSASQAYTKKGKK